MTKASEEGAWWKNEIRGLWDLCKEGTEGTMFLFGSIYWEATWFHTTNKPMWKINAILIHLILQTTGLSSNALAWYEGHNSEKQMVSSCKGVKYPWGLWRLTACGNLQVILRQSLTGYMSDNFTYGSLQQMLPWTKVLSRKTTPFTNRCFHEISSKVAHHATQYSIYNLLRYKIFGNKRTKITSKIQW